MTRDMIAYNGRLFSKLEQYCTSRGEPILHPGEARYIRTNDEEKRLLKGLRQGLLLKFGRHRSLLHLHIDDEHYIGMLGFEFEPIISNVELIDGNAGFLMCVLLECAASPIVSAPNVRNIVEFGKMRDPGYQGHSYEAVESLFPQVQVVRAGRSLDNDSIWLIFLMICSEECMRGGSWIEEELAKSIVALADLSIPRMPYAALCRSIFDADPRSLFMALYRCVEATYSHQSSRKLIKRLSLDIPWHSMAEALEDEIGWHPQEAASLNLVLRNTSDEDLAAICGCLRVDVGKDVQVSAGRAIYTLRNSIVHFRPGTKEIPIDEIDWNQLCCLMINVVFDVFTKAYL